MTPVALPASATGAAFAQATHFVYRYNEKGEVIAGERLLGDDPASPGAAVWPESFAYGFDDIGNRRQATRGDPAAPLARQDYVASPLNLYTSLTASGSAPAACDFLPAAPLHDLDGNLTDDARWHYTWDAENRLVAMETQPAAVLAGRPHQRLDFAYDYRSRRVAKKVSTYAAGQWTVASDQRFLYDDWNLIADLTLDPQTSTHNLACTYTWGLDLSGSLQGAGGVGGLLAVTRTESNDAASYFPTYDANGNVSEYLNQAGSIAAHREYGPFGEVIRTTGSEEIAPFGFSTKYTDPETGLLYYGYRYYNPSVGRWVGRDPIEESGGINLHGFVDNDPIENSDALGLVLAAFDGTGNDSRDDAWNAPKAGTPTNVAIMHDLYVGVRFYRNGVGTRTEKTLGNLFVKGLGERVNDILEAVVCYLKVHPTEPVDIIGFSRGAASARIFANALRKRVPSATIRFLGIFDTVAQIGPPNRFNYQYGYDQDVDTKSIGYTAHAVSADEHRGLFPLTSISKDYEGLFGLGGKHKSNDIQEINGSNYSEKPFTGVHSDIGGGYNKGGRNIEALRWMIERGQSVQAPFRNLEQYEYFNDLMDSVKAWNRNTHDSRYPILDKIPFTKIGRHKRKVFPGNN